MMGRDQLPQRSLFYTGINLDKRVRGDHVLRKVARLVDFDFVYGEVKDSYGYNGNVSVAPPMILKLMLLLVLYNVRSERELMASLPERLDWLWFLGLDLDSEIPDHSVLSKARKRWGVELFGVFSSASYGNVWRAGWSTARSYFVIPVWFKPMPRATPLSTPKDSGAI
jgi:transposase